MEKIPKTPLADLYDKAYSESKDEFGNGKPEPFVLEAGDQIPAGGLVLECGAGQGRNALALAERGFAVRAMDISSVGVDEMNRIAKEKGLQTFVAELGDLREGLKGEYDLIVSTFVLHHFFKNGAPRIIQNMKAHTKEGGVNAIAVFGGEGDFAKSGEGHFYPTFEEMRNLYADWEIVSSEQRRNKTNDKNPDGSPMFNTAIRLTARKPVAG